MPVFRISLSFRGGETIYIIKTTTTNKGGLRYVNDCRL